MRLFYDIISDKRNNKKLSKEDIEYFLDSYISGEVKDYQMSAMLMAIFFNGLDSEELATWASKMLNSGDKASFPEISAPIIDKHSTGGVGDKISIPLAPILGSLGFFVPMISGRGLGHTGGTLDKLESIPGFNVNIDFETFKKQVQEMNVSLIGQTPEIAPLDKKLYALRDVTATVESIPLIASSIMSKKLAEGINGLILDVKVGNGAFMKTFEDAQLLAKTMMSIGEKMGTKVCVVFSNMNEPLGFTVGNSLEIMESIKLLKGEYISQVSELVETMATRMLIEYKMAKDENQAKEMIKEVIESGKALEKFKEIVKFQGGDVESIEDFSKLPLAKSEEKIVAEKSGIISKIDALSMGKALVQLGGGRIRKEDNVDPGVGFVLDKKVGDKVEKGELLYTIFYNDEAKLKNAKQYLNNCLEISDDNFKKEELILGQM